MFPPGGVPRHAPGFAVPAEGSPPHVTDDLDALLDQIFVGEERISSAEIKRRALTADLPAALMERIDALPEGEYAEDEVAEILRTGGGA
jgi:hypothetical protein